MYCDMISQFRGHFNDMGFFSWSKVMFKVNYDLNYLPYRPTIIVKKTV